MTAGWCALLRVVGNLSLPGEKTTSMAEQGH